MIMPLVNIPGTNLFRDTNTMALVNLDSNGLEEYKSKRRFHESQKQEINTMKSEIASIKEDMSEIKMLMRQLMDKK